MRNAHPFVASVIFILVKVPSHAGCLLFCSIFSAYVKVFFMKYNFWRFKGNQTPFI